MPPSTPDVEQDEARGETALHFCAREVQVTLAWTVRVLIPVTAVTAITFWFWAIIPAVLAVAAYLALLVTNVVERRSDHREPGTISADAAAAGSIVVEMEDEAEDAGRPGWQRRTVGWALFKHEVILFSIGVFAVFIVALVIALTLFGKASVLLAALFLFAYILLLSSPVWFAALEDDIEDSSERLGELPVGGPRG